MGVPSMPKYRKVAHKFKKSKSEKRKAKSKKQKKKDRKMQQSNFYVILQKKITKKIFTLHF